jgi:hypothetical protein
LKQSQICVNKLAKTDAAQDSCNLHGKVGWAMPTARHCGLPLAELMSEK